MNKLFAFWISHRAELAGLLGQHLMLVTASTSVAVAIGVPLGIFSARRPRLASPLMAAASIVQTVPSLAMFGFLLPVPLVGGVGARAALVVLILYGLLPIVRTTIAGLRSIDPVIREAGVAMGMTPNELLRQVELPLALPSIVAGVRVAAVVGVGSATIAAAIGAGGLGEYIYRGLSMVDTTVILAGAIPAALLALAVDGALLWVERQFSARRRSSSRRVAAAAAALVAGIVLLTSGMAARRTSGAIIVGSKNFTEQLVLGEIVAQIIERDAGLPVHRRLNLGGTLICTDAIRENGTDSAAAARLQQYLCDSRPRRRCAGPRPADDRRCRASVAALARGVWLRVRREARRLSGSGQGLRAAVSRCTAGDGSDAQLSRARRPTSRPDCG